MKKYKSIALLLAGTLILGCQAGQAFGSPPGNDIILETTPDTSVLDDNLSVEKTTREHLGLGEGFIAQVDVSEVEAGVNEFSKKILYRTYDKADDPAVHIPDKIDANGDTYVMMGVERPLYVSQEIIIPRQISYESEVFTGDGSEHEPDKLWTDEDGIVYRLISKELKEHTAQERTEFKEVPVTFTAVESGVQIPDLKDTEIKDSDTEQTIKATLKLKDKTVIKEYWRDDFVFPITITGYDADVFMLNGVEVPREADLTAYADIFLQYLKLDEDAYRVSSIDWEGEPYEKDGILMRNAVGRGSKLVRDIEATYSGEVKLPAIIGSSWKCVYEEDIPADHQIIYTMTATAAYQLENTAVMEKSFVKKVYDKVVGIITAAYEAAVKAFEDHPVISSIPLVLLAAMIAFLITKKIKNRCVYNPEVKCPYRRRNRKTCKTCVHYHQRNQI